MERSITGFYQDTHGDWVADLDCGHGQHVRHRPPMTERPWVLTEEGRAAKLGAAIDCPRCDRFELPEGFAPYKRTADFDAQTIPVGLRKDHATKRGTWGVIHVLAGSLRYVVEPPLAREIIVRAGETAIIVPEVRHRVSPDGDARFFIEFLARGGA